MFCHNCGNKLDDGSKFCDKCGACLSENIALNVGTSISEYTENSPSMGKMVMQFIRGIPFGLTFLVFLLPLFVVSCNGISVAEFTTYDLFNLSSKISSFGRNVSENVEGLRIIVFLGTVLISSTIMAFACSFSSGRSGAVFGAVCLVDLVSMAVILINRAKETIVEISLGSGFVVSMVLFVGGIIMCITSPENEKDVPANLIAGLATIAASIPFVIYFI